MTTEEIKIEITDFTKRLNVDLLPSLAFESKRAALDAIQSLTTLVSTITEDEMKAAIDVEATVTKKAISDLEDIYIPSEDFSDEEIIANSKDPFGNDKLENVIEAINPNFDKSKLGKFKECTVQQYFTERQAPEFIHNLRLLFEHPDDEALAAKLGKAMAKGVDTVPVPSEKRKDRLYSMNGQLINSKDAFLSQFIADLVNQCAQISKIDLNDWIRSPIIINALAKIYRSYIMSKDLSKEEQDAEQHDMAGRIVLRMKELIK